MRPRLHTPIALALIGLLAVAAPAGARSRDRGDLHRYAQRTWASFTAMTDRRSGLPADILDSDGSTSVQTSTTNIGAYMWSAVAARRLGIRGFSPANRPEGDYGVWGVDGAGMDANGMPSNEDNTLVDHGFDAPGCTRPPQDDPPQSAYRNGVVTPHAAFLALRFATPRAAISDIRRLARDFPGLYGAWGFRDSVNVTTKRVSDSYLSLDQGMIMAALGNALGHDVPRHAFADKEVRPAVRPVIGAERFGTSG